MGEGGKRLSRAHRELVLRFRRKMAGPRDAFGHPAYNQGVVYSTLTQFGCEQGPWAHSDEKAVPVKNSSSHASFAASRRAGGYADGSTLLP